MRRPGRRSRQGTKAPAIEPAGAFLLEDMEHAKMMRMNTPAVKPKGLSVAQLGVAIMVGLLIIECAFIGFLLMQVYRAEEDAAKQTQQREVLFHSQALCDAMYSVHQAIGNWILTPEPPNEKHIDNALQSMYKEHKWLIDVYKDHPKERQQLMAINDLSVLTGNIIHTGVERTYASPPELREEVAIFVRRNVSDPKQRILTASIEFLRQQVQKFSVRKHGLAEDLMPVIWLGLGANLIAGIALAFFYASRISSRLSVMAENARKLQAGEKLMPLVAGDDEIAQLDLSFHQMAEQMEMDQRMRQTYILTFQNELGRPLLALKERLKNMESHSADMSPKAKQSISSSIRNLTRLTVLIDDLVRVDGQLELRIADAELSEVVERSIESVKPLADKNKISLVQKVEENLSLQADADRLTQVIINFLSNAIKFSPQGSQVTVEANTKENHIELAVIDKGRGIPADKTASLFEKFKQVEAVDGKRGTGTGLGLSICKEIIELHGGTIGVSSKEGEGSRFWFHVPKNAVVSTRKELSLEQGQRTNG